MVLCSSSFVLTFLNRRLFVHKDGKCLIDASAISTEEWKQAAYPDIRDNFSISLWVKPESDAMLNIDNPMGYIPYPWTEYYAIYPSGGELLYGAGHATCGLAVGRNGVAVWENGSGKTYFRLEPYLSGL